MATVDLFRGSAGVQLPLSISNQVWDKATMEDSVIMRLGTRVDVAAGGTSTPSINSFPLPSWVGESEEKAVGRPVIGSGVMRAYKLALIIPFSNEFRRDLPALYNAIANKLPQAIGTAFDRAVLYGPAPGADFDTLAAAPAQAVGGADIYADYVAALNASVAAGGDVEAWLMGAAGEVGLLGAVGTDGRPLFQGSATEGAAGSVLGRPVIKAKVAGNTTPTPDVLGFAGPWSEVQYGIVAGITVSASDQATINDAGTQVNLWQRNMFALRVEAELASNILDPARFVKLTA